MPTKHPRVNITLEPEQLGLIASMVQKRGQSVSAVARDLMLEALELQEDRHFSALAETREKRTKRWMPHDAAWK